jgi:hypothetical protein
LELSKLDKEIIGKLETELRQQRKAALRRLVLLIDANRDLVGQ